MKRQYRAALSVLASAGLLGGAGVAMGAVPVTHQPASAKPAPQATTDPAEQAELIRLKAALASTSGDGTRLQAQIARLEADIARARTLRQQRAAAAERAGSQSGSQSGSGPGGPRSSSARGSGSSPATAPTAGAMTSGPPVVHTTTGASGAATAEPSDDNGGGHDD